MDAATWVLAWSTWQYAKATKRLLEMERTQQLESLGFHPFDALHLACAESGGADVFLTTDDRLLRLASRFSGELRVNVKNPLTWVEEVTEKWI